jgi:hypothetical protein
MGTLVRHLANEDVSRGRRFTGHSTRKTTVFPKASERLSMTIRARLVRFFVLAACLAVAVPRLLADAPSFEPRVEQWGTQELLMRSAKGYANPFRDVQLEATFQASGVSQMRRPLRCEV